MNSIILRTATRFALPLLMLLSIVVMLQGHHKPGGGFIGGLIAAAAFSLHALAFSASETRRVLLVDQRTMIGVGLLVALASAFVSYFLGQEFMTGVWTSVSIGAGHPIKVGTPLLFDMGVYLVVIGISMLMVLTLLEPREEGES